MRLPLIDPYPMHEGSPSDEELCKHRFAIANGWPVAPLRERISIANPVQHVTHATENFNTNIISRLMYDFLKKSNAYKNALKLMPKLSAVKEIWKYRNRHGAHNENETTKEIENFGLPLSAGQILFHGGVYPRNESTNEPLSLFLTNKPLSTSLCAQVAAVHCLYHTPKEIWIIKINESSTTKAFLFNSSENQNLGHEIEVLIAPGARAELKRIINHGKYTLYEVDIT